MKNPWLDVPLVDYEAHMLLPNVGQAQLLSDIFASALEELAPKSLAVLGCAGGNGFDRIAAQITERIVGVDINPEYINQVRARFSSRLPRLELIVADLERDSLAISPVDMVFAALVLEYIDVNIVIPKLSSMLRPGGIFITVSQLSSDTLPEITPTEYTTLNALAAVMKLVDADKLDRVFLACGYHAVDNWRTKIPGGKCFQVQKFRCV
jgi:SAM-dependent methyltransferase